MSSLFAQSTGAAGSRLEPPTFAAAAEDIGDEDEYQVAELTGTPQQPSTAAMGGLLTMPGLPLSSMAPAVMGPDAMITQQIMINQQMIAAQQMQLAATNPLVPAGMMVFLPPLGLIPIGAQLQMQIQAWITAAMGGLLTMPGLPLGSMAPAVMGPDPLTVIAQQIMAIQQMIAAQQMQLAANPLTAAGMLGVMGAPSPLGFIPLAAQLQLQPTGAATIDILHGQTLQASHACSSRTNDYQVHGPLRICLPLLCGCACYNLGRDIVPTLTCTPPYLCVVHMQCLIQSSGWPC
jgi:hypothetical protein